MEASRTAAVCKASVSFTEAFWTTRSHSMSNRSVSQLDVWRSSRHANLGCALTGTCTGPHPFACVHVHFSIQMHACVRAHRCSCVLCARCQLLTRVVDGMLAKVEGYKAQKTPVSLLQIVGDSQQIHSVCLFEIVRQVTSQCAERGALLKRLWE